MSATKIEWATDVWNPVTGCTKVSQGCKNCYAERVAGRFWGERKFTDVRTHPERLSEPDHWKKPRRVFVNSMSDLFHVGVPRDFIAEVFDEMICHPKHTFMVLTKRPATMVDFMEWYGKYLVAESPNIWLGVSVEDQHAADERIPLLLQTPAAVRFVSCEPLLGPVDLSWINYQNITLINSLNGDHGFPVPHAEGNAKIDWVIAGGESGSGARPMHPDWARSLRDQCQASQVPFFFKQWGEWEPFGAPIVVGTYNGAGIFLKHDGTWGNQSDYWYGSAVGMDKVGKKEAGRLLDGREWNELPDGKVK